jgi:formylmethanofuran dehydrogenase subunit E
MAEKTREKTRAKPHVEVIDIGNQVVCDSCGEDYTNSEEKGGILFCSKGICPKCTERWVEGAKRYGEERYIYNRAKEGESFKDFILRVRDGDNKITITTFSTE